jgi:hypothetical protein
MRLYDNLLGHDLLDPNLGLNKRGHRCKDIEDIRLHNYILFAGDNVALDFNSPVEETYPYLISKDLNMDYYNLAIFNGGIDAFKYNILSWFKNIANRPKMVIVSFEFLNSIITCDRVFENFNVADYNDERCQQILTAGEVSGFFPARQLLARKALLSQINVPLYQIEFENKTPLFLDDGTVNNLKINGDKFNHMEIAESLIKKHNSYKRRVLP